MPYKIECANHQVYNRLNMSNLEDNKDQMPGPDYSGIKSFYIYASQNSQNDVAKSPSVQLSQEGTSPAPDRENVTKHKIIYGFTKNAPTTKKINDNLEKANIYNTRPPGKSVTYSSIDDADEEDGINMGSEKIKVEWERNLPSFQSQVLRNNFQHSLLEKIFHEPGQNSDCSKKVVLQCVKRAPSSKTITQGYKFDHAKRKRVISQTKLNVKNNTLVDRKKFKIRLRKISGDESDSSGSVISQCSDSDIDSDNIFDADTSDNYSKADNIDAISHASSVQVESANLITLNATKLNESYRERRNTTDEIARVGNSETPDEIGNRVNEGNSFAIETSNVEHQLHVDDTIQIPEITLKTTYSSKDTPTQSLPIPAYCSESPNISVQNLCTVKEKTSGANETCKFITILSMECFIRTRQNLLPDPEFDAIDAIFYSIENDVPKSNQNQSTRKNEIEKYGTRVVLVDGSLSTLTCRQTILNKIGFNNADDVSIVPSEDCLITAFIEVMQLYDPDILVGYDCESSSYGYLVKRAAVKGN